MDVCGGKLEKNSHTNTVGVQVCVLGLMGLGLVGCYEIIWLLFPNCSFGLEWKQPLEEYQV